MALQVAVLACAALALFPQQPSRTVVIGTILEVSARKIQVKTPVHTVGFRVNTDTEVYKSGAIVDPTALRIGELVSVHSVRDASGATVATAISAHKVTVRAVVRKVNRAGGEILASPETGRAAETRVFRYYPSTVFGVGENVLSPGHEILVVGLEFRDGVMDAARIAAYNTDLPHRRLR
jgi:hypothetical protein